MFPVLCRNAKWDRKICCKTVLDPIRSRPQSETTIPGLPGRTAQVLTVPHTVLLAPLAVVASLWLNLAHSRCFSLVPSFMPSSICESKCHHHHPKAPSKGLGSKVQDISLNQDSSRIMSLIENDMNYPCDQDWA